ncbi:MAG: hypothetical protein AAF566_07955 [Pseudomonadota bacterium]
MALSIYPSPLVAPVSGNATLDVTDKHFTLVPGAAARDAPSISS